ncbi:hypothetical protein KQX54_015467 [Cotesia glomerata]|uniref:Uncharacterized protein n=1 Tax=Cotesia glomerata TaxID=32391 RepID=A0AAV7HV50_COTGL|nr:hypothetical protein KQX54_015467 [Cotesia glomerata]
MKRASTSDKANTVGHLLTNKKDQLPDSHQVKVAILGSGYTGVAVAVSLLFKEYTAENQKETLKLPDQNGDVNERRVELDAGLRRKRG